MGRKEYFENLEELKMLRSNIISRKSNDAYFTHQSKQEMLIDVDARLSHLKRLVECGA